MAFQFLENTTELFSKIQPIKGVIFDVDGVFTNGLLYFNNDGEYLRAFHVQDGLGVKNLIKLGYKVGIISAKSSAMVQLRLKALGITDLFLGCENKVPAYENLIQQWGLDTHQIAYIGDDLPDLPLIMRSGFGATVKNANFYVKNHADYITQETGGNGAVREICDLILCAQDKLDQIIHGYTSEVKKNESAI